MIRKSLLTLSSYPNLVSKALNFIVRESRT